MRHIEDDIQTACIRWFRLQYPNRIIFHIPNGGRRNIREAARLKKQGVLAGVPDLFIPEPINYFGLFIEMKSPDGKLSENQKLLFPQLRDRGYRVEICRSLAEFMDVIQHYLGVRK